MLPDPKWLDALKLPLRLKLAIAAACGALFYLFKSKAITLGAFDGVVIALLLVTIVVFAIVVVFDGLAWLAKPLSEKRRLSLLAKRRSVVRSAQIEQREEQRGAILAQLDHLSRWEVQTVVKTLQGNSPTFYSYVFSPPISMLQAKNLVWTPGGPHNQDHYPFCFADFVWDEILKRREEFIERERAFKAEEQANERAGRGNRW